MLLDILAYNTLQIAFYTNMAVSEGFLDSAQLVDSVASHSKELNYLPRSKRSARAKIRCEFSATGTNQPYTIEKGSTFTSQVKNQTFIFSVPEAIVVSSEDSDFMFETDVYEGVYQKDAYIVNNDSEILRYKISSKDVDTTSITVTVYEDGSLTGHRYTYAADMLGVRATTKIFFLQSIENGYYEVVFGDGIVGRRPKLGSRVLIDYRISSDSGANGARFFTINFDPTATNTDSDLTDTPIITTILPASDGADRESLESVRYYAPRHFQVQQRAVIDTDYEIMLKTQFPEINAVSAFGGEELDPPRFGSVYISVDVAEVDGLPDFKKREYYSFLKQRNTKTIDLVFIEPDFTYAKILCRVKYNINVTDSSAQRIKTLIENVITDYNEEFLDDFKVSLRHSKLQSLIDAADDSIVSNELVVLVVKRVNPELTTTVDIITSFDVELDNENTQHPDRYLQTSLDPTITSSRFRWSGVECVLHDDGLGKVRIMKADGLNYIKLVDIGTIDYTTGKIQINGIYLDSYTGSALELRARTKYRDIEVQRNTILTINPADTEITIESVRL